MRFMAQRTNINQAQVPAQALFGIGLARPPPNVLGSTSEVGRFCGRPWKRWILGGAYLKR